jgi:acyl-CoA synthetase (AMP-forming)/AMP-acid ligase II/thioesterase domain-containing protein/aryl carrier-like protein
MGILENTENNSPGTIGEMIAYWAERTPGTPALLAPGRVSLTYGRLQERVSGIAGALRSKGVRREDRVAIILPNGPEMATAFLAAVSAAVCAPLNPGYTPSELEFYLTDLRARAVVVSTEQSQAIAVATRLAIPILQLSPNLHGEAGACILEAGVEAGAGDSELSRPEDVALVLHTSGTTARPKIVPLTHRNLCASAGNIRHVLRISETDRCLNVMPLFHIHGLVGALLSSLSAGASVACPPGFSAADFFSWMSELRPTWYTAVPTMHQAILARAEMHRSDIARHSLRFVRSSSAALAPSVMSGLESVFDVPVIESYGMTEAAHQMASNLLPPGKRKTASVGPAAGPEIAIMDEDGNLVPAGQTGEIVIRGENVTRGYEDNPKANESAFCHGWFRTGDQGYFDGEHFLYITGRIKELINRGGEKISPREVDEILLQHPAVLEAVTFAVPHCQLGETVGAAVVLRPGLQVTALEIREFASKHLANFKVPQVLKLVNEIPRGSTGKIQRIGLAERLELQPIDESNPRNQAEYTPARTPIEIKLAGFYSEILKVEKVGVHDNFFFLGGDSIAATQLMSRVCRETGTDFSFMRFLETPTIAALAAEIESKDSGLEHARAVSARLVPIQPDGSKLPLFCAAEHNGSLMIFCRFARHLDPDLPIWGFPPFQFEDGRTSYRLEDLAARYVEQMRAYQPEGPYRLAGFCYGGTMVYEMARQLHRQGESVVFLAMLDSFNYHGASAVPWTSDFAQKLRQLRWGTRFHLRALAERQFSDQFSYLIDRLRALAGLMRFKTGLIAYRYLVSAGRPVPGFLRKVNYANALALERYIPTRYPGTAVLFRVLDSRPDAPQMGWSGLIGGGVDILDSPYHHQGVQAESTIQIMALQLQSRLDLARSQNQEHVCGTQRNRVAMIKYLCP